MESEPKGKHPGFALLSTSHSRWAHTLIHFTQAHQVMFKGQEFAMSWLREAS